MADRFREHCLDVVHEKSDVSAEKHFNGPGHPLEDAAVIESQKSGLRVVKKNARQHGEMRKFFKFQTRAPRGMNRDFLFVNAIFARANRFN